MVVESVDVRAKIGYLVDAAVFRAVRNALVDNQRKNRLGRSKEGYGTPSVDAEDLCAFPTLRIVSPA
jgi:hypothetical protein